MRFLFGALLVFSSTSFSQAAQESVFAEDGLKALQANEYWYFLVSFGENRGEFRSSLLHEYETGYLDYSPGMPERSPALDDPPARISLGYEYYFVVSRKKGGDINYYHFNQQVSPLSRLLDSLAKTYYPWGPDIEEVGPLNLLIEDNSVYSKIIPLDIDSSTRDDLLEMLRQASGCNIAIERREGFDRLVVEGCD
ncbi:MAG: hypothetical protein WD180_13105 [Pseudohongiellaceae bacterium]